jgi:hypothetical protein
VLFVSPSGEEDGVNEQLLADFRMATREHRAALERFTPLIRRVAIETLADVLPDAATIEAHGELNEDWIPTLRIQRVLDADGRVLFDIEAGHRDRAVEDAVDLVDIEYLDVLIDLTGDEYMGHVVID